MNRGHSVILLPVVSVLAGVACGGSPPPTPTAPTKPVATAPPAPPPVDLSQVPEPASLLLVARLNKPENVIKAVGAWTRVPLPSGRELSRSMLPDAVADVIEFDAPIDAASTLAGSKNDPRPTLAISFSVASLEQARSKLGTKYRLSAGPNGQEKVEGVGDIFGAKKTRVRGHEDDDDDEHGCVLAPAAPKGARLVCGEEGALEALVPYMTRTLPREQWSSDVHVEVRPAPVREPLDRFRAMIPILARGAFGGSPAFGSLADSAVGEVVDLVSDVNRITIDAKIADWGVDATTRFDYQRTQSMIAKLATARADRAGPAPPAFFHLPQETDISFFGRGSDPKLWDHPRELLGNVLFEVGDMAGLPDAEKQAFKALVADRMVPLFTGPGVYGKGFDPAAVKKLREAYLKAEDASPRNWAAYDEAEVRLAEQVVGWHLFQSSEPISKVGPVLKDWATAWNKPAFTKWMKAKTSAKTLPRMRIAPAPAGVNLPKDSVHLEVTVPRDDVPPAPPRLPGVKGAPPAKPTPLVPIVFHVIAVPDAGATWLGFGLDAKLIAQRAAASLSTAAEKDTLAQAQGLEPLKDGKLLGGGYFTMRGLLVFAAFEPDARSPYALLDTLPHKGKTPLTFTLSSEPPNPRGEAGSATSNIRLPRALIEDIVKLAMSH